MEKDFYYIWLKDLAIDTEHSYALTILRVDAKNRDLIWDMWKAGVGSEFFKDAEIRKNFVVFDNYFLRLLDQAGIDYESINHDTLEYEDE